MPALPRNSSSKATKTKDKAQRKAGWKGLTLDELKNIGQKIKEKFKWNHTPREFQLDAIKAQLRRKDVLIHAGTGSGKTFIAAGPHAHEGTEGMVTLMVSPLIALQEEQAKTFEDEYKLSATAINSAHGGCTKEIMADICSGKWQIVVISPEMMLSKRFVTNVLRNAEMRSRILSIVIDEAHVVSHWGSGFRKKYGTLGILRALLPKDTPMVAMSATLPSRVRRDVLSKLQYDENNYTYLNLGNDRPNVSLVVRAIQNSMNSYSDLDFLIPTGLREAKDIKKSFVYADNITVGSEMMEHLYEISPDGFREEGVIRTYSAAFSAKYRRDVMELFKAGHVRILICTDAAGMGCNIPDIDIVVQWKLPSTVSSFVQRAGRAARGFGRAGLAVLLVEKSAYDVDLTEHQTQASGKATKKKGNVREASNYPKSKDKNYAVSHGVLRGSFGGASDAIPARLEVPFDQQSLDEGLHTLVQTTDCRRKVLTQIYANDIPSPTVSCCDICDPTLFNQTRPAPPVKNSRKKGMTPGMVDKVLKKEIISWRKQIWTRDFGDSLFGPSAILSNVAVESLSSFGHLERLIDLEGALGGYWAWFGRYGDELLELFKRLNIAPKKAKAPKPRAGKRAVEALGVGNGDGSGEKEGQTKRPRTSNTATPTPVAVKPRPGPSTSRALPPPSTPLQPQRHFYLFPNPPPAMSSLPPLSTPLQPQRQFYPLPIPPPAMSSSPPSTPVQPPYQTSRALPPPSTPLQPQRQSVYPLANNPYAQLATQPVHQYQQPQTPYNTTPIPFQPTYYPFYFHGTPSSSSQQPLDRLYYPPYPYTRDPPPPPPPPPPST